jgi:hypothetical protein
VPQSPVGAYFNQAADILVYLAPQVTLGHIFTVHNFPYSVHLGLAELVHPRRNYRVQLGFDHYLGGCMGTNTIDAAQSDVGALTVGYVYPGNTNHCNSPATLVGGPYPCRWECLGLEQIIRTTLLRLMTRHLSHLGFTDAVTFIV